MVSASAPQTLRSTRAGGQDDVSSNKLPQIIRTGILQLENWRPQSTLELGIAAMVLRVLGCQAEDCDQGLHDLTVTAFK